MANSREEFFLVIKGQADNINALAKSISVDPEVENNFLGKGVFVLSKAKTATSDSMQLSIEGECKGDCISFLTGQMSLPRLCRLYHSVAKLFVHNSATSTTRHIEINEYGNITDDYCECD